MVVGNEKKDIISPLLSQKTHEHDDAITIDSSTSHSVLPINKTQMNGTHVIPFDADLYKSITISFEKINYTIGQTTNNKYCQNVFSCWKQTPNKQILFDLSGFFTPGMNAILGIFLIIFYL
jgi:hypothetical protein